MLYTFYFMLLFVKTCEFFSLTSVFVLAIRYFIMYNVSLLFFSVDKKFYSGDLLFYHILLDADWYISVEEANWKLEILITVPLFFRDAQFFLEFSIMSLFKLLIKFLCCIISKVLILLLRIYTVITFCKSVICIYNRHILYLSLLANYLCQVWLRKLHINLRGDIELNSGPK